MGPSASTEPPPAYVRFPRWDDWLFSFQLFFACASTAAFVFGARSTAGTLCLSGVVVGWVRADLQNRHLRRLLADAHERLRDADVERVRLKRDLRVAYAQDRH